MAKNLLLVISELYKKYGNEIYISNNNVYVLDSSERTVYSYTEEKVKINVTENPYSDIIYRFDNTHKEWNGLGFCKKNKQQIQQFSKKEVSLKLKMCNAIVQSNEVNSFTLPKQVVKIINDSFKEYDATHIEFLSENNKLLFRMFDAKRFVQQEFAKFAYADLQTKIDFNSSFSLRKEVFSKLKTQDYEVRVLDNDIVSFENDNSEMFSRTQEITTPLVSFVTPTHQHISLLLEPTIFLS